jgi:hypothetical protein
MLTGILSELVASVPNDLPPTTTVDHLLPLDLPAQMVYHDNDGKSPRLGVRDSGDKSMIRVNREHLHDWLAMHMPIQYSKRASRLHHGGPRRRVRHAPLPRRHLDGGHYPGRRQRRQQRSAAVLARADRRAGQFRGAAAP